MITTKNRAVDLRRTCRMLRKLDPAPAEILITVDGCQDETLQVVKSELPEAILTENLIGMGSVAARDSMIRKATGDLILALDDDSYPEQTNCISAFQRYFEDFPNLAVLHFPQRTDEYPETLCNSNFGSERPTRCFANSGAVLRRSIYFELPGFETRFFHMYEEPDYALQCVAAGYEVRFSPRVTIRHHYSGRSRNELANHHRQARNELWSVILRCPFPYCLGLAGYRALSQLIYSCKRGPTWVLREPFWWADALTGVPYCLSHRRPIEWHRYRKWLELS